MGSDLVIHAMILLYSVSRLLGRYFSRYRQYSLEVSSLISLSRKRSDPISLVNNQLHCSEEEDIPGMAVAVTFILTSWPAAT
jgi:hypothetical protein